ncbi:pectate lyase [Allosphingosinicella deserti]|nr:pectate lyase [Sphingomonas deserti]
MMFKARFLALALLATVSTVPAAAQTRPEIEKAMKRATTFMVEKASTNGGYVWSYLPDMSRRWGEIEATPNMIWVQPPGTATMGHLFLDAYHATGDDYYYQAAEAVAGALIRGQHRSGGWHYFIDFGGPAATRHWYETIGKNAWRMEEFQHYADNSTFDDMGTSEAAQFLLRIYLEKQDPKYRPALEKAVNFVLDSQYPAGGWPQRWPFDPNYPGYQSYITFNDEVAAENVKFLLMAYQHLGDTRVLDAITRGMNVYLLTQQAAPQAGWALQYTLDLKPAAARTYEPNALHTASTADNVEQLMNFYRMTGDGRFLARIPEALDWLDSVRLAEGQGQGSRRFPTFIEIGTNKPVYVHRRGSNVVNGTYYWDYSPEATLGHYSAFRSIDVPRLRRDYEALKALPVAEATRDSPLLAANAKPLPRFFVSGGMVGSDLNAGSVTATPRDLIRSLNSQGWWPTPLKATSNPYKGDGSPTPAPGDFRSTHVGDETDTSPYTTDHPVTGISTATYMANMVKLMGALRPER